MPDEVIEPMGHTQWVGPGCHFIAYYIRQKKFVNIVTQEDTDKWVEEGWSSLRSRRDAVELPQSRTEAGKAPQPCNRVLEVGSVHAAADAELGPRPHSAHRRRAHAMLPNAGQAPASFQDAYILGAGLRLARSSRP